MQSYIQYITQCDTDGLAQLRQMLLVFWNNVNASVGFGIICKNDF